MLSVLIYRFTRRFASASRHAPSLVTKTSCPVRLGPNKRYGCLVQEWSGYLCNNSQISTESNRLP